MNRRIDLSFNKALYQHRLQEENLNQITDPRLKDVVGVTLCEELTLGSKALLASSVTVCAETGYETESDDWFLNQDAIAVEYDMVQARGLFDRLRYLRKGDNAMFAWALRDPQLTQLSEIDEDEILELSSSYDVAWDYERTMESPILLPVSSIITVEA